MPTDKFGLEPLVVVNTCYGGFNLSQEAIEWLIEHRGWRVAPVEPYGDRDMSAPIIEYPENMWRWARYGLNFAHEDLRFRTHPDLIAVVEALEERASGPGSRLAIANVETVHPWRIREDDGMETIEALQHIGCAWCKVSQTIRWLLVKARDRLAALV